MLSQVGPHAAVARTALEERLSMQSEYFRPCHRAVRCSKFRSKAIVLDTVLVSGTGGPFVDLQASLPRALPYDMCRRDTIVLLFLTRAHSCPIKAVVMNLLS